MEERAGRGQEKGWLPLRLPRARAPKIEGELSLRPERSEGNISPLSAAAERGEQQLPAPVFNLSFIFHFRFLFWLLSLTLLQLYELITYICIFIHSLFHSSFQPSTYRFIHLLVHAFIQRLIHLFLHLFIHPSIKVTFIENLLMAICQAQCDSVRTGTTSLLNIPSSPQDLERGLWVAKMRINNPCRGSNIWKCTVMRGYGFLAQQ